MKRISFSASFVALLLIAMAWLGCSKTSEPVLTGEFSSDESLGVTANAIDPSLCKLRTLLQDYGGYPNVGKITYNSAGDPYSILYQNGEGGTGNPSYYFKYDNQKRLIEMYKAYQSGAIVSEIHRYSYTVWNSIGNDTAYYIEGDTVKQLSFFKYDTKGRIIQEYVKPLRPGGTGTNKTFVYDSRGNLAIAGIPSSSYDNKVNPLRVNRLFMFLNRNYSNNNPVAATAYNSKGLPLDQKTNKATLFFGGYTSQIGYDCQ